jgi:predicted Rossmann fold flavoprotein
LTVNRIVVVGGGPAGMMAAIRAAQVRRAVTLIEKNSVLGKKLSLSGSGRCNLTNVGTLDFFIEKFSHRSSGQFLRDAFKKFFNRDLIRFFEERGVELKVEQGLRVFPESDRADRIAEVLRMELKRLRVNIIYRAAVKDILVSDKKVQGVVLTNGKFLPANKIILATGGVTYKFTGSTGVGLEIARKLGHSIVPLKPGLVPLETKEEFPRRLAGVGLTNVRLLLSDGKRQIQTDAGDLLFTRFGVSGPLVLSLSGTAWDWRAEGHEVFLEIDLLPELSHEQLDLKLIKEFGECPRINVSTVLAKLFAKRLALVLLEISQIAPDKKADQVTYKERGTLVNLLKCVRLTITKTRSLNEAMVTRGGVSLKEIDPRTMQSRLIPGLYFAGEIMDVAADTGGFNLQAAFSTGYLAGESAAFT